jgi:leucyl-tRNA synthetase
VKTGQPIEVGRKEVMSKSKKNVVPPARIIETYGADTARWFVMSDSPPERDMEWTDAGVEGAWRFTQRLWRIAESWIESFPALTDEMGAPPSTFAPDALALRRIAHKTVAQVTETIEKFNFNSGVAAIYKFANALGDIKPEALSDAGGLWARKEALDTLALLIGPMLPHLAEEIWRTLGHETLLVETAWPTPDANLVIDDQATVAVQVNGKLRATIQLPRDCDKAVAEKTALSQEAVQRALEGKAPKKIVVVPNRIVNIVA